TTATRPRLARACKTPSRAGGINAAEHPCRLRIGRYSKPCSLRRQSTWKGNPMRDFEYEAPTTLAAAIELAAKHNGSARCLPGGTDLIDQVRVGRLSPDVLIDVKKIAELNVLEHGSNGLRLGAAVPCYQVYEHGGIVSDYSALADSCRIIGGVQIQNRASVGGNLCNSGPAADSTPSLIALGAVAVIAGPKGRREVAVEDFCTGPGKN